MKKSRPFNVVSDTIRCKCGRLLKLRVLEEKEPQNVTGCFRCYKKARTTGLSHKNALLAIAR